MADTSEPREVPAKLVGPSDRIDITPILFLADDDLWQRFNKILDSLTRSEVQTYTVIWTQSNCLACLGKYPVAHSFSFQKLWNPACAPPLFPSAESEAREAPVKHPKR